MARGRTQYALIAVFLVCSQHVLAQDDKVTFSASLKGMLVRHAANCTLTAASHR